jgi:histidine triad (HIT) family protein
VYLLSFYYRKFANPIVKNLKEKVMSQTNPQTTTNDTTYDNTKYDDDNIFAKMLNGDIPYHKVYEDDKTLAFMDIMPQAEGHVLVIPKQKAVDLGDLEPEYAAAILMTAKKIMQAQRQVFKREGIIQMQLNGAQAGQTVFHYHLHLIPSTIHELGRHAAAEVDHEKLAAAAKQLAAVIGA